MGQIILAVTYITLLCWFWGYATFRTFTRLAAETSALPAFPLLCLTGITTVAPVAGVLSLCIPLGGWLAQGIIAVPALLCWLLVPASQKTFVQQVSAKKKNHWAGSLLLFLVVLMVGVMGAWVVIHPDTLGYHAQTIRWIEAYRVVPGLVHLHARYGYQGYWFVLCALFSFRFTGTPALTFVNLAVLCWFLLFVAGNLQRALGKPDATRKEKGIALLSLLLLIICFADFGQLRLTAVSASPDFISGIFVWTALYVLATDARSTAPATHWLLAAFVSMIAVTIKLSALPLTGLVFYAGFRLLSTGRRKACLVLLGIAFIVFIPFTARNVITSGYTVFPATFPDLFQPDWKFDHTETVLEKQYISDYARVGPMVNRGDPPSGITAHVRNWLPVWWSLRSPVEKGWLTAAAVCLLTGGVFIRKMLAGASSADRAMLLVSLAGLLFWWWQAPNPRFAYGFLLALPALILDRLAVLYGRSSKKINSFLLYGMLGFSLAVASYTVFRLQHYFTFANLWAPAGVYRPACKQVRYRSMLLNVPQRQAPCAGTPLPCSDQQPEFILRGVGLQEGFRGLNDRDSSRN